MAPIVLKIEGDDDSFSPLSHLTFEDDDLTKTWRVCTKVKDSLENGSRLENLTWRLWFVHNATQRSDSTKQEKYTESTTTPFEPPPIPTISFATMCTSEPVYGQPEEWIQPQHRQNDIPQPYSSTMNRMMMEEFVLHQYTSDQACDQVVQLENPTDFNATTTMMNMTAPPSFYNTNSYNDTPFPLDHAWIDSHVNQTYPDPPQPTLQDIMDFYIPVSHNNKLLSTLPPQTLASAERLLSPIQSSTSTSLSYPSTSEHRNRTPMIIKSTPSEGQAPICSNCESTSTPIWRRSSNDELLCNACGLYWKLHKTPRPKYLKAHLKSHWRTEDGGGVQMVCSNCAATATPLWRRDIDSRPLCNACGLYLKLHNEKRPLSMKSDVIKKRQRSDNSSKSNPIQ